mmetsp:Transcript_152695/g.489766  ORF Transcript_152695/g.489766 Transcript_152695/m.489766 type:complete len:230 (+) Transcript_152695:731-1420(+)
MVATHLAANDHELLVSQLQLEGDGGQAWQCRLRKAQVHQDVRPAAARGLRKALLDAEDADVALAMVGADELDATRQVLHVVVEDHHSRGVPGLHLARLCCGGVQGLLLKDPVQALGARPRRLSIGCFGQVLREEDRGLLRPDRSLHKAGIPSSPHDAKTCGAQRKPIAPVAGCIPGLRLHAVRLDLRHLLEDSGHADGLGVARLNHEHIRHTRLVHACELALHPLDELF